MSHEVRNSLLSVGLITPFIFFGLSLLDKADIHNVELPVAEVLVVSGGLASVVAVGGVASYIKNRPQN